MAVGFATAGRPAVITQTLLRLRQQSRKPDAVIISAPALSDVGELPSCDGELQVLLGTSGLTRQRNAILRALPDHDLVVFFDDDFLPHPDYLAQVEQVFGGRPKVVAATGRVLADGITGPGYSFAEADAILEAAADPRAKKPVEDVYSAYGCNMAYRLSTLRRGGIDFDESLPLYGWLEDVDFSRRVAAQGSIVKVHAAMGVHLGVKGGRQSGRRLGYSQIANPVYLVRKGTFSWTRASWLMLRNIGMNCVRSLRPEPHIDRPGRVVGNARALLDLCRGKLDPARVSGV